MWRGCPRAPGDHLEGNEACHAARRGLDYGKTCCLGSRGSTTTWLCLGRRKLHVVDRLCSVRVVRVNASNKQKKKKAKKHGSQNTRILWCRRETLSWRSSRRSPRLVGHLPPCLELSRSLLDEYVRVPSPQHPLVRHPTGQRRVAGNHAITAKQPTRAPEAAHLGQQQPTAP